jgi:hypothetical protein
MNIVYYSNYCTHSQKLLQYLAKNGLTTKVNCICIDQRKRDAQTNQTYIYLEKGGSVLLPPNVHCVPALLLVNEKYRVLIGQDIYAFFAPKVNAQNMVATQNEGEPESFVLPAFNTGMNIQSEQYTFYNMSPDELSAKGMGGMRQMYNYVSAQHSNMAIQTPPDTYRPNKVSAESVEALEQTRNNELQTQSTMGINPAIPQSGGSRVGGIPTMNSVPENRFVSSSPGANSPYVNNNIQSYPQTGNYTNAQYNKGRSSGEPPKSFRIDNTHQPYRGSI